MGTTPESGPSSGLPDSIRQAGRAIAVAGDYAHAAAHRELTYAPPKTPKAATEERQ